ncbi:unnamed protein product [Lupinus luteus]|uniref:Uncharacterized protein n=1 Tax=Lupinus luteus TaxID=3873 RepID=A0AAV1W177_LUPLU
MAKCNILGRGEACYCEMLEKAKGKITKMKARVQELETVAEVKESEYLMSHKASKKANFFLVDWVIENYHLGQVLEVVDPKMNLAYDEEEVELVLMLGLLCFHHEADYRPTMKEVTRYLNFYELIPNIADWTYDVFESSRLSPDMELDIIGIPVYGDVIRLETSVIAISME